MDKYKSFSTVPLKEGQEDTERTRIERWEEANGIPIKALPHNEWIHEMSRTLAMTERECEEWWWHMGGGLEGSRQQNSQPVEDNADTMCDMLPYEDEECEEEYMDDECETKSYKGFDIEFMTSAAESALAYITDGVYQYVDYVELMLQEWGYDVVGPYVKCIYGLIRDMPQYSELAKHMDTYQMVNSVDIAAIHTYMEEGYSRYDLRGITLPLSNEDYNYLKDLRAISRTAFYHFTHGHEFDAIREAVYDRIEREVMQNWPAFKYSREDLLNMKMPISDEVYRDLKTLEERDESSFYWLTHGNALRNMRMYVLNRMGEEVVGKEKG